ncbi:MAG: TlpA disulfide reductase family protein [Thiogranum sp.]
MITERFRRTGFRDTAAIFLTVCLLWLAAVNAPAGELSEVTEPLRFKLRLADLSGQQHSLDEYEGQVLLVNFWASWCRPCLEEMPSIKRLAREMRGKPFAVLGVNVGEGERRVHATAKRFEIDFPVLLDKDSAVFSDWGATVLPTAYILDRSGRVRHIGQGPLEWDRIDIIELLGDLLEQ